MAASDIQGNFSIQFKSSALMEPIEDIDLMGEEIKVSATLGDGVEELNYEYRYPFNQKVAVNLNVEGFTPESAEAFFQRQISETQGSRMASFPIDLATGKGIATFTSPGSYILRYVRLDGVEYELEKPLRVYVSGFAVDSVQVGQSYFMTADQNVTTSVSVNFGASEALCVLALFTPAAIPGLTLGCILFNISFAGALPLDFLVGSLATLLATAGMYGLRKVTVKGYPLFAMLLPAVSNAVLVGWELSVYVGGGFWLNALYVAIGEAAVLLTLGTALYYAIRSRGLGKMFG